MRCGRLRLSGRGRAKGEFNPSRFQHVATYNFQAEAMQSFLVAKMAHGVRVERLKRTFEFDEWEAIHVESSHKFSLKDIETLAARTGFKVMDHLLDERRWFCDSLWRVQKD